MLLTGRHVPTVRKGLLAAFPPERSARPRPGPRTVGFPFGQILRAAGGAADAAPFLEGGVVSPPAMPDGGERVGIGNAGGGGGVGWPLAFGGDRPLTGAGPIRHARGR